MKTKILLAVAALLLCGCTQKPSHQMALNLQKKYPGCELVDGRDIVPVFFVRTADGAVLRVVLNEKTDDAHGTWLIFPPKKETTK